MRKASLFARYDPLRHSFVVYGEKVPDILIGMHKITVEASFVDPNGQTQFFSKYFYLHVKAA